MNHGCYVLKLPQRAMVCHYNIIGIHIRKKLSTEYLPYLTLGGELYRVMVVHEMPDHKAYGIRLAHNSKDN